MMMSTINTKFFQNCLCNKYQLFVKIAGALAFHQNTLFAIAFCVAGFSVLVIIVAAIMCHKWKKKQDSYLRALLPKDDELHQKEADDNKATSGKATPYQNV
eukprot:TRINITY_DN4828_c0_g2_i1.p1 TRINITY_DN4828_c0_g2~~TRINITY_DN4828_c0_g2_i1.p1  ORF type:complete len:101 (+),score=18.27 TRINITY_DN4828_c0_g2_i1:272-574(+)